MGVRRGGKGERDEGREVAKGREMGGVGVRWREMRGKE